MYRYIIAFLLDLWPIFQKSLYYVDIFCLSIVGDKCYAAGMKIFEAKPKAHPDWYYWGDYGVTPVSISSGEINDMAHYEPDPVHYHKKGKIYVIAIDGELTMEIDGKVQYVSAHQVLEIDPGEQYRCLGAHILPARWITICSVNDKNDKVIVD